MLKEFIDEYKKTQKNTISLMGNLCLELNNKGKKEFLDYTNSPLMLKEISMVEKLANEGIKKIEDDFGKKQFILQMGIVYAVEQVYNSVKDSIKKGIRYIGTRIRLGFNYLEKNIDGKWTESVEQKLETGFKYFIEFTNIVIRIICWYRWGWFGTSLE